MKTMLTCMVLTLSACSSAGAAKPSPAPLSITVHGMPAAAASARYAAHCAKAHMAIEENTERQLVCAKPMDDSMKSMFLRALATPSYSTKPVLRVRANFIEYGGDLTVTLDSFWQYQNAYGQTTTIPNTNAQDLASLRQGLEKMKAEWEAAHP